jgi:hypothetical protein
MISAGIILIHASLHQSQAEDAGVEIQVFLRRSGNRRYVMDSFDVFHGVNVG